MPRSTADRRKAQIVKAAFKVISKKGFANSAIREIAQEAGMPVPTMYQWAWPFRVLRLLLVALRVGQTAIQASLRR